MDDPTFADVTLVCEGKEVQCHRVILAAKSNYFRSMFDGNNFVEGTELPQLVSYNCQYRVFHGFVQAELDYGGLILGSSQFT